MTGMPYSAGAFETFDTRTGLILGFAPVIHTREPFLGLDVTKALQQIVRGCSDYYFNGLHEQLTHEGEDMPYSDLLRLEYKGLDFEFHWQDVKPTSPNVMAYLSVTALEHTPPLPDAVYEW